MTKPEFTHCRPHAGGNPSERERERERKRESVRENDELVRQGRIVECGWMERDEERVGTPL